MSNFMTLLVEDDTFQREILADVLKEEGFEVIECTTAEAAELIIASTGTELQALVTDNNLAGAMSGAELAQYASCRHPKMNIIIISGKTVNHIPVNATFLQKPFLVPSSCSKQSAIEKRVGLAPEIASIPHAFSHTAAPCGQRRLNSQTY